MRRPFVQAVVGLALLGGCTATAAPDAAPRTTASRSVSLAEVTTLTCAGAIDGSPPTSDYETVLGVVALTTHVVLGASDSGEPRAPALFAKVGLLIRANQSFELDTAPRGDDRVAIGWGCPDTYGTGWLTYPGGYWADRPLCLPLTLRAGGREQQVRIGVGAACR
jgi:hypothetical protein